MTTDQHPNGTPDNSAGETPLILLSNRYKVLSVLGDGGFGQTFLVEDTHMPSNRQCVLKQLKPIHDRPNIRQMVQDRFQREAATLEKLGEAHAQIPRLHAYFSEGDQYYLVEEWVQGVTLTQKVAREGPQSEATVQTIISKLLPAIAYVHSQKIVHRDIKPDNIILRQRDSLPVLIDFGAVKESMKTIIHSSEPSTHSIVVGTPGYMPGEQLSGRPIYASDIYSLGMTAIFLLTGKNPQELLTDPQTGSLSWREHATNVSPGFANFLDCATHMSPQSRFPSAQDMQYALNTLMMGQMSTHISTQMPPGSAPNPSAGEVTPAAATTSPQSSQTVISSTPMGPETASAHAAASAPDGPNTVAGSVPTVGQPVGQPTSQPTAVVSPLANQAATFNQPNAGSYPQPVQTGSSSGQWKGPAIIGGMVGISILIGALVLTERLPIAGSPDNANPPVAVVEPVEDDEAATEDDEDATDEDDANELTPVVTPQPTPGVAPSQPNPPAAPNANGTVVGQGSSKNIRSGAGTTFNVVDSVTVGSRIQVIDRSTDSGGFPWYRVVTPGGSRGWIAGQLIQIDGDAPPPSRPTPTPTPQPPGDRTNGTIVSRESGSKNIRSGPGTNHGVVHIAYPGDRLIVEDSAQDSGGFTWYRVTFPESGAQGWIAAQLVDRD